MLPKISSYGNYSDNRNVVIPSLQIDLGEITLYYSYNTIVAYSDSQDGQIVCRNEWGVTTGKHLNWINPNHKTRTPINEFQTMLIDALKRHIQ